MMMESYLPSANQNNRRVRVLIVDDTPQVRRDLHQFLDLAGDFEVIAEAVDGQEAVHMATALTPDVIVMDLEMPGMDGFEATRLIKAHEPAPWVVILSVHGGLAEQTARAAGADSFVIKGTDYQILINAILGKDGSTHSFEEGEKI